LATRKTIMPYSGKGGEKRDHERRGYPPLIEGGGQGNLKKETFTQTADRERKPPHKGGGEGGFF